MSKDKILEQEIYKELLRVARTADDPEKRTRLSETTRKFKLPDKLKRTAESELALEDGRRRGKNPYFHRGRIDDGAAFFGRARELVEVERLLVGAGRAPLVLTGPRRIGKSSFVSALARRIRAGSMAGAGVGPPTVVVVDALETASYGPGTFYEVLTRAFIAGDVTGALDMGYDPTTPGAFARPVYEPTPLPGADRDPPARPRVIVCIDEFDTLLDNPSFDRAFFSGLANLARLSHVSMLLVSVDGLARATLHHGDRVAPVTREFTEYTLGPLMLDEARALIAVPSARENYPLLPYADRILALSGRFPLLLQISCSVFFDALADSLGQSPIDDRAVRARFLDEARATIRYLAGRLSPADRAVLAAAPFDISGAPDPAMRVAAERGYLEERDGRFRIFSDLFTEALGKPAEPTARPRSVRVIYSGLTLLATAPVILLVLLFALTPQDPDSENRKSAPRPLKGQGPDATAPASLRPPGAPKERILVELKHVDPEVGLPTSIQALYHIKEIPFAKLKLKNNGDFPVTIKLSHQIKQRTHLIQETFELAADEERRVPLYVTFQTSVVRSFTTDQTGNYFEIRIERIRRDGSVEPIRVETGFVKILANNRFSPIFSYLGEEGGVSLWDTLVAWVDESQVRDVVVRARLRDPSVNFIGYQAPSSFNISLAPQRSQMRQVKAIYESIVKDFKIDYSNSPEIEAHMRVNYSLSTQVVKFPSQVLKERGGNCVELSILVASALKLVELDPLLILFPGRGHAIFGWRTRDRDRDRYYAFDTNQFGRDFEVGIAAADKFFDLPGLDARSFRMGKGFHRHLQERGLFHDGADLARSSIVILDVRRLQETGLRPIKM